MASPNLPPPQLYLISPELSDERQLDTLDTMMQALPIACLLARLPTNDEQRAQKIIRALIPLTHAHNTALLIPNPPQWAMRNGADGCHISFDQPELLEQAIATLKPQGIVGVGGLKNKHDAMSAGERDIDYVMFGEPSADGYVAPLTQRSERVQWWASIFNVPCVAYADHRDDIAPLCQAGADFIALGPVLWQGGDDALSTLRALHQLIEASAR